MQGTCPSDAVTAITQCYDNNYDYQVIMKYPLGDSNYAFKTNTYKTDSKIG